MPIFHPVYIRPVTNAFFFYATRGEGTGHRYHLNLSIYFRGYSHHAQQNKSTTWMMKKHNLCVSVFFFFFLMGNITWPSSVISATRSLEWKKIAL